MPPRRPKLLTVPSRARVPMKAILCTRYGGPDDLEFKDLPDPRPGQGEVVVAVKAAALNFFDTLIIAGKYQVKPPFPFSPASEFAGVVESVGAGVSGLAPGDRVLGYGGFGAAREKVQISATARGEDSRHARLRPRRRHHGDLRHHAACPAGSCRTEVRRDARGARRLGRHRIGGNRDRQADGRARDRLRILGRQARLRARARRRRGHQLRDR